MRTTPVDSGNAHLSTRNGSSVKIVPFGNTRPIPHQILENGDLTFFDYPEVFGLEVGDFVQYSTELGFNTYRVVEVKPAMLKQHPDRMTRVTAKEVPRAQVPESVVRVS